MIEKGKVERGVVELVDTESLVPQEHLLRKVDKEEGGRPEVDPVVLFKIVLLQHLDGIPSLRETLRRLKFAAMNLKKLARRKARPSYHAFFRFAFVDISPLLLSGLSGRKPDRPFFDKLKPQSQGFVVCSM